VCYDKTDGLTATGGSKGEIQVRVWTAAKMLRRLEMTVMPPQHRKATVTLAQHQNPAHGVLDHSGSLEHQLLHHCADSSAPQVQGTFEEVAVPGVFDSIKVILAQTQQAQVGLEHIAGGDACPDRKGGIEQGVDLGGLQILANQGQTGVRTELVGKLFDNKVGHGRVYLLGEPNFTSNLLIYNDKIVFMCGVMDL